MKNQTRFLIMTALILGAVYAYKFTDWFKSESIQIKFRSMPRRDAQSGKVIPVTFYLGQHFEVTSLKVVSAEDAATNKYPHALWHLIPESKSASLKDFGYGVTPPGMKPKIAGLNAEPLRVGKNYKILIEAGKLKAEKEFQMRGR